MRGAGRDVGRVGSRKEKESWEERGGMAGAGGRLPPGEALWPGLFPLEPLEPEVSCILGLSVVLE